MDGTEKEIVEIKEAMQRMEKSMDRNMERIMLLIGELAMGKSKESSAMTKASSQKNKKEEGSSGEKTEKENEEETEQAKSTSCREDRGKLKRLEMPVFTGKNPDSWLFRAETYFEIHQLTDEEKIKVSIVSFDEWVVDWYHWAHNRKKFRDWADLKARLFKRFRPTQEGSLCERLLSIKQESTVAEYIHTFEIYSAPLPKMPDSVLENTFLNGLKPVIKAAVKSRRPVGLEEIMIQAQLIEDREMAIKLAEEWGEWGPNAEPTRGESSKTVNNGPNRSTANNSSKPAPKAYNPNPTRAVTLPDTGGGGGEEKRTNHEKDD